MGYSTWFTGSFEFDKPVSEEFRTYINSFAEIRHMKRDVEKIKQSYPDWAKQCWNGNLGADGEYFIGGEGSRSDTSIINKNRPGGSCPELWCQWIMDDEWHLMWDGGDKFYSYIDWLKYLINNFIKPSGYTLNGNVSWQGEESDDLGVISVNNNVVSVEYGIHVSSIKDINTSELIAELESRGYTIQN